MKNVILGTALTISSIFAGNINVEVTNILSQNGKITMGLYNKDDDTFGDVSKHYKGVDLVINGKKVIYTFKNIPNGTYAIAVIHDENENGKLDKNFFGMPTEGYSFSNNIRPLFRGANFQESKFALNNNIDVIIKMKY